MHYDDHVPSQPLNIVLLCLASPNSLGTDHKCPVRFWIPCCFSWGPQGIARLHNTRTNKWQLGCSLGWSIWCPCGRFQSESHGPHLASGWTRRFRPLWRPKSVVFPFCGDGCNLNRSARPSKFQHVPTYFEATGQLSDHNTPIFQLPNRDPSSKSWDVNSPTCCLRGKTH